MSVVYIRPVASITNKDIVKYLFTRLYHIYSTAVCILLFVLFDNRDEMS